MINIKRFNSDPEDKDEDIEEEEEEVIRVGRPPLRRMVVNVVVSTIFFW
jgi:hypothetical protein